MIETPIPFEQTDPELAALLQWYYLEPDQVQRNVVVPRVVEKVPGRNDPCSCGSGKKYKKCCGGT